MRRSIFLRRIILLLAAAVLLSGVLSAGIYLIVMQRVYVDMQSRELLPIAQGIAQGYDITDQEDKHEGRNPLMEPGNKGFLGAKLHLLNTDGEPLQDNAINDKQNNFTPDKHTGEPPPDWESPPDQRKESEDLTAVTAPAVAATSSGEEFIDYNAPLSGEGYLVVGVPIWSGDGSAVIGAVVFTKKLSELSESLYSLQVTLVISTLLTFVIMLIPGYFAARRLAVPVQQMRDVSLSMAKGDFSVRADETQKGELGDLAVSINRFAEETQRLDKTRQDYVSNVSHELRTPIAAIRAMSETLSDGMIRDDDKKRQYYEHILRESMRLSRLVDDLLELSRLQSGGVALQKHSLKLADILRNSADVYGEMASDADITLRLDADLDGLPKVWTNSDRIEQVLVILLDNAIKHTPEGGIVTLGARDEGDYVSVFVHDTGGGIPAQDLPYVFDRFYKVDKAHSSTGFGLGLSIAAELLHLLNESITVESPAGSGARFTFSIHKQ